MKEAKFLMFFSALMELHASCSKYLAPCTLCTTAIGNFLSVKQLSISCEHLHTWNSQPCIGKGALPAGNFLLSASIPYAGASPTQVLCVLEFLSINEVGGSYHMKLSLSHSVSYLLEHKLSIGINVTDHHRPIGKWIKNALPGTICSYDVCHMAKGTYKYSASCNIISLYIYHIAYYTISHSFFSKHVWA